MDHPIHLHGRKMEILDEHIIQKWEHCDHVNCNLSDVFLSDAELQRLADIPAGSKPLKDTFILPAGGTVATRIFTGSPALWFAHCHLESHRESGMAMILNVGNYQSPPDSSWLPSDYPKCDTAFLSTKKEFPSCDCYIDEDALMDNALTKDHRCSRDYLCFQNDSPQSSLESYPYQSSGITIRSQYSVQGWVISLIIVFVIAVPSYIIAYRQKLLKVFLRRKNVIYDPAIHTAVQVEPAVSKPELISTCEELGKEHVLTSASRSAQNLTCQKNLITNNSVSSDSIEVDSSQSRTSKRGTISILVKRDLPLTMALPGHKNSRRTTIMVRRSFTLPTARKNFTVPKRRTQLNIEVEGFRVEGNLTVHSDGNDTNEQTSFGQQFWFLFHSQWLVYRSTCVSLLRMTEVTR